MNVFRIGFVCAIAAFTFVAFKAEAEIPAPAVQCQNAAQSMYSPSAESATVVVMRCNGSEYQMQSTGTAARVGPTRWVSALHVMNWQDKLYTVDAQGERHASAFTPADLHTYLIDTAGIAHEVTGWRAHPRYDIVAFDVPGAAGDIRPVRTPMRGEDVQAWGPHPGASKPLRVAGGAADPLGRWPEPLLELDGRVEPGYSGGPILDRAGNMVGLSYAITYLDNRTYAVPASAIIQTSEMEIQ